MVSSEGKGKTTKKKKELSGGEAPAKAPAAGSKADGRRPLIIVESPAKARTLNGFLKGRFHVEASMGHLVDLPERTLGVNIEHDFEPEYRAIPGRREIITKLKEAGKGVPVVLLATDPDREGEAIAWHVANQVLERPDSRRIEFHEITKSAIEKALEHPRDIDVNLVEAQQARRILDRLVGYLLSPLLWKKVQRGLSAGRVQSVAVRLVCDREEEIRKFDPVEYYVFLSTYKDAKECSFTVRLDHLIGEMMGEIKFLRASPPAADRKGVLTCQQFLSIPWLDSIVPLAEPKDIREMKKGIAAADGKLIPFREGANFIFCLRETWKLHHYAVEESNLLWPEAQQVFESFEKDARRAKIWDGWEYQMHGETLPKLLALAYDKEAAEKRLGPLREVNDGTVTKELEQRPLPPSPPFITSTLQQEGSRRLSMSPRKTMSVAQKLYEGVDLGQGYREGLITYMRTDSVRIADEALYALRDHIQSAYGSAYLPEKPQFYKTQETAQGAHEAIRPTQVTRTPESMRVHLSTEEFQLYDLIWRRFVASQMAPAQLEKITVTVAADPFVYKEEGQRIVFDGFLKVYPILLEKNLDLFGVVPGPVTLVQSHFEQNFTPPPPRYTVATLIKTLEKKGIGRPSTYAPTLQTIQDREYVAIVRRKRKEESTSPQESEESEEENPPAEPAKDPKEPRPRNLVPTPLGEKINKLLVDHFKPIMDYKFTAELEEKLDKVEEGHLDRVTLLREFFDSFSALLEKAKAEIQTQKKPATMTDIICEKCGGEMVIRDGRYGKFLACSNFPKCKNTRPLPQLSEAPSSGGLRDLASGVTTTTPKRPRGAAAPPSSGPESPARKAPRPSGEPTDILCEKCGGKMVIRTSRYGKFLACSNYPKCKNTKPLEQAAVKGKCPKCGSALSVKRSRKGRRTFFGCSTYPACDFATWNTPTDENCKTCGSTMFKTGKGDLVCHKPDCPAALPTK